MNGSLPGPKHLPSKIKSPHFFVAGNAGSLYAINSEIYCRYLFIILNQLNAFIFKIYSLPYLRQGISSICMNRKLQIACYTRDRTNL